MVTCGIQVFPLFRSRGLFGGCIWGTKQWFRELEFSVSFGQVLADLLNVLVFYLTKSKKYCFFLKKTKSPNKYFHNKVFFVQLANGWLHQFVYFFSDSICVLFSNKTFNVVVNVAPPTIDMVNVSQLLIIFYFSRCRFFKIIKWQNSTFETYFLFSFKKYFWKYFQENNCLNPGLYTQKLQGLSFFY